MIFKLLAVFQEVKVQKKMVSEKTQPMVIVLKIGLKMFFLFLFLTK